MIEEIMINVRTQIESAVLQMTANVNEELEKAVSLQVEMKKKELNDLEANLSKSEQEQQKRIAQYQEDLRIIEQILG